MRIYLAAPLFTMAERRHNEELCHSLERVGDVFLPQRDGVLLAEARQGRHLLENELLSLIYRMDCDALRSCDVVVAIVDGAVVDDGVAFELGFAAALGKRCIGVTSDSRRAPGYFRNPMWSGCVEALLAGDDVVAYLQRLDAAALATGQPM